MRGLEWICFRYRNGRVKEMIERESRMLDGQQQPETYGKYISCAARLFRTMSHIRLVKFTRAGEEIGRAHV